MKDRIVSYLDDDGLSPEVTVIEEMDPEGHHQALSVRVGPVWRGDDPEEDPVIWVDYQAEYQMSSPMGPVLIDVATWRDLEKSVNVRLRRWRWRRVSRRWSRIIHPSEW